ncbi:prolyl oligopeptidase family serine peptidase [Sphingomonas morindae]|uniref:prolyl oligopeptidase n=1 Tax=Sphingomonas morindae TaxID=1541170 RepID=A0ABY4X4P4_9SPHN|nr:prolyl oligopeptidase family serine peptidase [Sphingomonas morindae]USI71871.1 prolyl oligopeptidase family serine peptidase [Sphingomonas morindae]
MILDEADISYPPTWASGQVDTLHGVAVPDPYRWLEADVRSSAEVRAWVEAEAALTDAYLARLPARAAIAARLTELWNYARVSLPVRRGDRYFFRRNSGLDAQAPLYVRDGLDGEARLLIDPAQWSEDGATALAEWAPSPDGTRLAYAVQDGGSDWRSIHILDLASGETSDVLAWVKFSGLAWAGNGSGIFYSRFPEPKPGAEFQAANLDHAVHFHRLGTPQSADFLVHATPDRPKLSHVAEVTEDGRWLLITSAEGTEARYELTLIDLTAPRLKARTLVRGLEQDWRLAGAVGDHFYFVTDLDAPRRRVVAMDVASPMRRLREIVPESEDVLEEARVVGDRLLLSYLHDVAGRLRLVGLDGRGARDVMLPGIGSVLGLSGRADGAEGFYAFASYDRPTEIHRIDTATGAQACHFAPRLTFDPARFVVEQHKVVARDGVEVPLFLLRRRDCVLPAPTLLYGYGGFAIALTPGFSPAALAWAEMGGVYAVANIRGGGEYGKAWHDAGRRHAKQTVFDDFIACAEHLVASGIARADGLAIHGHSNGGLLVSAVTNQRPELFAAALPAVGVHDMLRFTQFTAGRYWTDDYGDPADPQDFATLHAYSPLHRIRDGVAYPAVLVATADTDDRVVPAHSFKYAAALQAAALGPRPRLIRIETRAGHGAGKSTQAQIAEIADLWAFAAYWTGLRG